MGIDSLLPFIRKKCPQVIQQIHISEYAYEKITVDVSGFIYRYKYRSPRGWLSLLINLLISIRQNYIHPIFIFDGPAPIEKKEEQEKRKKTRDDREEKTYKFEAELEEYDSSDKIGEEMLAIMKKHPTPPIRQLHTTKPYIDINWLRMYLKKMKNSVIHITEKDVKEIMEIFTYSGSPVIQAPSEAETLCASIKDCRVILSGDTDVLVYGDFDFLFDFDSTAGVCSRIIRSELLEALELTADQFKDFCILCGTDYNPRIPGVGPVGAYKLIKTFGTIEKITLDTSGLNFKRVRELFTPIEWGEVPYTQQPDIVKIKNWLYIHKIKLDAENFIVKQKVVFED